MLATLKSIGALQKYKVIEASQWICHQELCEVSQHKRDDKLTESSESNTEGSSHSTTFTIPRNNRKHSR